MKTTLWKMKLDLDRLRKERMKLRKNKEYHQREMSKAKREKNFLKQKNKVNFYQNRLDQIRQRIEQLNNDIIAEENSLKDKAYKKELISFKRALVEDFSTFLNLLDEEEYQEAFEQLEETESQYAEGSKQFLTLDLEPLTSYFSFVSIKRHIAIILDRTGQYHRLKTTRGLQVAAGYKGATDQKVKMVYGIVESIIQILMPTVKRGKKKVKEKQLKRKEDLKEKENTSQPEEEPEHNAALERAAKRFKEAKARGEI